MGTTGGRDAENGLKGIRDDGFSPDPSSQTTTTVPGPRSLGVFTKRSDPLPIILSPVSWWPPSIADRTLDPQLWDQSWLCLQAPLGMFSDSGLSSLIHRLRIIVAPPCVGWVLGETDAETMLREFPEGKACEGEEAGSGCESSDHRQIWKDSSPHT